MDKKICTVLMMGGGAKSRSLGRGRNQHCTYRDDMSSILPRFFARAARVLTKLLVRFNQSTKDCRKNASFINQSFH